jgi:hypothetical protein
LRCGKRGEPGRSGSPAGLPPQCSSSTPLEPPNPTVSNIVAITAGENQSLAIRIDLEIASIVLGSQGPILRFHTFAGQNYWVEYSPDMSAGSWSPLPNGSVPGDGYDATLTDADPTATSGRFYRIRRMP